MSDYATRVLHNPYDVFPFLDIVRQKADSEKNAFGFLPKKAYENTAQKGDLFVATIESGGSQEYAGHLMAGGLSPTCRIFQIFVDPQFRKNGIARSLLNNLVRRATSRNDLCIRADVATDLTEANAFWERSGLPVTRIVDGGKTRNRKINIRVRNLDTPNLFSVSTFDHAGEPAFHLCGNSPQQTPKYLLDLNVLFDIVKKRAKKTESEIIIKAGQLNIIDIAVAPEVIAELERDADSYKPDTAMDFALELPQVLQPDENSLETMVLELAPIVFPEKMVTGSLSTQDKSDLRHLGTTIISKSSGFITSEKTLLRASDNIRKKFGISIISTEDLSPLVDSDIATTDYYHSAEIQGMAVQFNSLKGKPCFEEAELFMNNLHVPKGFQKSILEGLESSGNAKTIEVRVDNRIIVLASWSEKAGLNEPKKVTIIADEDHPKSETSIGKLFNQIVFESCQERPALLELNQVPGQTLCRKIALSLGFLASKGSGRIDSPLRKIAIGRPLTQSNWDSSRIQIQTITELELPPFIPNESTTNCKVTIGNEEYDISPQYLENILSPCVIVSPTRGGVIVPIREHYASQLLGTSLQLSFLPSLEATLHSERTFFSAIKNRNVHKADSIIAFYESQGISGRGAVVAIARILYSNVIVKRKINYNILKYGVIAKEALNGISVGDSILITTFDNLMHLGKPISLNRLRELKCDDGTNFVCSKAISPQQLVAIIEEGILNA